MLRRLMSGQRARAARQGRQRTPQERQQFSSARIQFEARQRYRFLEVCYVAVVRKHPIALNSIALYTPRLAADASDTSIWAPHGQQTYRERLSRDKKKTPFLTLRLPKARIMLLLLRSPLEPENHIPMHLPRHLHWLREGQDRQLMLGR